MMKDLFLHNLTDREKENTQDSYNVLCNNFIPKQVDKFLSELGITSYLKCIEVAW